MVIITSIYMEMINPNQEDAPTIERIAKIGAIGPDGIHRTLTIYEWITQFKDDSVHFGEWRELFALLMQVANKIDRSKLINGARRSDELSALL
ncbi:MAG: hypothetical protein AB9860_05945 [Methanomassiliicoccales archaeon]